MNAVVVFACFLYRVDRIFGGGQLAAFADVCDSSGPAENRCIFAGQFAASDDLRHDQLGSTVRSWRSEGAKRNIVVVQFENDGVRGGRRSTLGEGERGGRGDAQQGEKEWSDESVKGLHADDIL